MYEREHYDPSPAARKQPVEQVSADKSDVPDSAVEAAQRAAPDVPRHVVSAMLGAAFGVLADETPDHYGPGTQTVYAAWLREQAAALRGQRVRPRRKLI